MKVHRTIKEYQLNKFKEVTEYLSDLQQAKKTPWPKFLPMVILDKDFESAYLKTIKEEQVRQSIIKWRDQGKQQFFELANNNQCSAYWPVDSQEHLLTVTRPDLIHRAIKRLETCQLNKILF